MNIVVTGAGGQLGRMIVRVLEAAGKHRVTAFARDALDVTDEGQMHTVLAKLSPDAIVHTAAFTDVDRAESELARAFRINALGTRNAAAAAEACRAKLVTVSTDYVFDGAAGRPYTEEDNPAPINAYGLTKLAGELYARDCPRHFIIRTAWLYGGNGKHFVRSILRRAKAGEPLCVVDDTFGTPTYAKDLASVIAEMLETECYGLYHAVNSGGCSRYEWAHAILEETGLYGRVRLERVTSSEFVQPAARPRDTRLDCRLLETAGLTPLRHWREALRDYLVNEVQERRERV